MPSNSADSIKKLNEEYEEALFRLAMNDLIEEEGKFLFKENIQLKDNPEFQPSQEEIDKFTKLLDISLKKSKSKNRSYIIHKIVNTAAVITVTMIILFSTGFLTVQAFRIQVLNFLIDTESKYTSFQLSPSNENQQESGELAVNWTNAYIPTYTPENYAVTSVSSSDSEKRIIFTNKKNEELFVMYCEYSSSNSVAVDTENASVIKKVKINGEDGTLSIKDTTVTVVWIIDDHLFTVQGQISTDEAIKLAESVKFIE